MLVALVKEWKEAYGDDHSLSLALVADSTEIFYPGQHSYSSRDEGTYINNMDAFHRKREWDF